MSIRETVQEFINDNREELKGKTTAQVGMLFEKYCIEDLGLGKVPCTFLQFRALWEELQRDADCLVSS